MLLGQDSEPGRLVGLPYIIGDLTYIFPSVRLSHIEQSQHFCIGTIYPRVLEQTQENNITANQEGRSTAYGPTTNTPQENKLRYVYTAALKGLRFQRDKGSQWWAMDMSREDAITG